MNDLFVYMFGDKSLPLIRKDTYKSLYSLQLIADKHCPEYMDYCIPRYMLRMSWKWSGMSKWERVKRLSIRLIKTASDKRVVFDADISYCVNRARKFYKHFNKPGIVYRDGTIIVKRNVFRYQELIAFEREINVLKKINYILDDINEEVAA